jgi:hypothetical protein
MIQIESDPAERSREPVRDRQAVHLAPPSRTSRPEAVDAHASDRPSLFVVPPPQPVWPRVFPGL